MNDREMRAFLEACGSAGPLILGVEEPGASGVSWRVFDQPFAIVGRDPGSDLVLNDPAVSRRHAYIQMIAGGLFCVDLHSRTGTRWDDEAGLWGWVRPDAGVRVGPFRLRSRAGDPDAWPIGEAGGSALPAPVSRSFELPALQEATVEIIGQRTGSLSWRASRALVLIGRSPSCKIRLPSGGVSSIHAGLLRTASGVFVVDLLGAGGTIVNGESVRCARLGRDDEISVGGHRIRVRCGPSTADVVAPIVRPPAQAKSLGRPSGGADVGAGELLPFAEGGEETESLVRMMLGEFGLIQQQTADRFQQNLMAVLQSADRIHREQMELIREELARIRELSEEHQALRAQVEGPGRADLGPPVLRLVSGESFASKGGPSLRAVTPLGPTTGPPRLMKMDRGTHPGPVADRPAPVEEGPAPPTLGGLHDAGELHARIFDRLAKIQGERQGRWQRLLESLIGK